jgi:phosphoglycerol transferase MdoB-like AlkP superfamily enzyme
VIARLRFCILYMAFWMGYYAVLRGAFLAYHHAEAGRAGAGTIAGTFLHGARMDLAATAGPCLIVFPLLALSAFAPKIAGRLILALSLSLVVVVALLATIDVELYRAWGFRIDGSILQYFKTPRVMVASSTSSLMVMLTVLFVALAALAVFAFIKLLWPAIRAWEPVPFPVSLAAIPAAALLVASLYIPLHGGIQKQPIKQSTVYFSQNDFANQAAINVTWNFLDGVWHRSYRTDNPYQYLGATEAAQVVDSLLTPGNAPPARLLRLARPNVIIILWESLTSKVVERLGGMPGITPNLDSLTHEGILFDHFYATGNRSPRGLTGVISGYPSQPTTEIIMQPRKSASLPALPHEFSTAGYHSRFYYGGDPAFANFTSYLMASGFDTLITDEAFESHNHHTEWGEDDQVVLTRMFADVPRMHRPFLVTLFTMSSHEPFVVPMETVIPGSDEQSKFLNAHVYADRSVGEFIRQAKREPWWDSTLVVIVGDHGHRFPVLDSLQTDRRWEQFSIPMLWVGGALAVRDTVVSQVGAQTDIPATLLHQFGLNAAAYRWSRDLLAPRTPSWAWFTFNDGFGFINGEGGKVAWDNIGRRVLAESGPTGAGDIRAGEALLQQLVNDYVKR